MIITLHVDFHSGQTIANIADDEGGVNLQPFSDLDLALEYIANHYVVDKFEDAAPQETADVAPDDVDIAL